jgi:NTP pyrophosphatase (non-canonical NTP hydrolase)
MVEIKEYQEACKKTAKVMEDKDKEICNWGLGVAGEAGDVASCIKKEVFHENKKAKDGIRENIGDMMWYVAMICNFYDWSLDDILSENLEKLNERYSSGGFSLKEAQREHTMKKWSGQKDEMEVIGGENGK